VQVWDIGTFKTTVAGNRASIMSKRLNEDLLESCYHSGYMPFELFGQKLKGKYYLWKFPKGGNNTWLLTKRKTDILNAN